MKFALCNEMFENQPFEAVCDQVADCGYDGIEIAPFTLHEDPSVLKEQDVEALGRIARARGLSVTAFHWLLARPAGLHLTTADESVRRRTTEFLSHLARLCAAMQGEFLVLGSPKQRDLMPGVDYEDAFARARDTCRAVCEIAGPLGVTLALEPLGDQETTFMVSTDETVRLLKAVDHPACRLHLDVKAMCTEDTPVPETITRHAGNLAYFHANDANRRGPGFGEIDFVPIFSALKQADYDKWVSVEVFNYNPDPLTIARQSIDYLKRTMAKAK